MNISIKRTLVSSAVLAALATVSQAYADDPAPVQVAQAAPAAAAPAEAQAKDKIAPEKLETVIVTGTARSEGVKKLDASFSITTASEEQIKEAAPSSTADLLKIVPGVWAETTGGESGANIFVRGFPAGGDAPFTTIQFNGSTIFPPPTLSFLENSTLFRLDDTIDHVEVLRGGPSPIFSNGQTGVTVNFIAKKGTDVPEGSVRLTTGTGQLARFDAYYGGKIADNWYLSGGGFYRTSNGIRDTQYPADRGGQFSLNLTRKLVDGELNVYGRVTNDKNTFFLAVPLISGDNGHSLSAFPGFDPHTGTLYGNDVRLGTLEVSPGATPGTINRDLADGRGIDIHLFGASLDKKVGDWTLSDKANYLSGNAPTYALFTGPNPQTLGSFINGAITAANGKPNVVAAAGGLATGGTASFVNGGTPITDLNKQVIQAGFWSVDKRLQSFTNDLRVSRDLFTGNTATVGLYFADYSSDDLWYLGNSMLLSAETNAKPIDVRLNNGVLVTRHGFNGAPFFDVNAHYNGRNTAVFVADEWKLNDRLRFDGGARFERERVNATLENVTFGVDLDNNPLTLYNNDAAILNGTHRTIDFRASHASWTAGVNYYLTPAMSTFARVNAGYAFPQFDNLRDGQDNVQTVRQYELGLKTNTKTYAAFLTGFYNYFTGLPFQVFANGQNITSIGDSRAYGLEFEGALRPIQNLEFALTGVLQKANYENYAGNTGHRVIRQPRVQYRFTPSYRLPLQFGTVKAYTTYTYVGDRFADIENLQFLPSYHTLDAGVVAQFFNGFEVRLTGTNLTNQIGITEGNTRVIGNATGVGGVFMARPIFGRAYELSLAYQF